MKYGLTEALVTKISAVFASFPEIEKAVLYGSRAKGNFKTGSDIDLTLYGEGLTSDLHSAIASALDDLLLPHTIDLSIFDELNHAKLREHIERVGVVFYARASQDAALKKGWKTTTIGEVCQFRGGGTPSKAVDRYWRGKIPWVSPKDMKFDVILDSIDHISQEAIDGSATSLIPKNSVLMVVRSGILARTVPIAITGRDLTINQDLKALCPTEAIDTRFLYHLLDSKMDVLLSMVSRGATVHRLMTDQIRSISFPRPPLPEQQRIVGILDEAFEAIATTKANAEKNLQNARALFESHLQSIFSRRGNGWVEKRLVEVSREFGRGKSKHRPRNEPKLYDGKYPFIQTGDISNADHWLTDYTQTYSELGLAQSRLWPRGTICIAIVGATVGETAILDFQACFPDSVIGIVVDEKIADNEYVEFLLQSFKALLKEKGKGTARDNINLGTFENQRFPFPALDQQKEIVATLNSLREETKSLESVYRGKLAALEELKKSLLHKAFAGDI